MGRGFSLLLTLVLCAPVPSVLPNEPVIPPELLEDPHFRAEFGINELTTPSISRIFDQLSALGNTTSPPSLRRESASTPVERPRIALHLGSLIADGFFLVQSEDLDGIEAVGRAIVKHASALGAGLHFTSHSKALVEHGEAGDWARLRIELVATQREVERQLILLRDIDLVRLIGLGGWLRALEVVGASLIHDFSPERSDVLRRVDIADFYLEELQFLEPSLQESSLVLTLRRDLETLRTLLALPPTEPFTAERITAIDAQVRQITTYLYPTPSP